MLCPVVFLYVSVLLCVSVCVVLYCVMTCPANLSLFWSSGHFCAYVVFCYCYVVSVCSFLCFCILMLGRVVSLFILCFSVLCNSLLCHAVRLCTFFIIVDISVFDLHFL